MAGLTSVVNRHWTAHASLHTIDVQGNARRVTAVNRGFTTRPAPRYTAQQPAQSGPGHSPPQSAHAPWSEAWRLS